MTDTAKAPSAKAIVPLCRHTKTNGRRCQSPALRGGSFCYFHLRLRRAHRPPAVPEAMTSGWQEYAMDGPDGEDPRTAARVYPHQDNLHFPPLEDAESVQLATSMLFQAIATGQIHFKRARLLLYTLKIACINQRALRQDRNDHRAEDATAPAGAFAPADMSATPTDSDAPQAGLTLLAESDPAAETASSPLESSQMESSQLMAREPLRTCRNPLKMGIFRPNSIDPVFCGSAQSAILSIQGFCAAIISKKMIRDSGKEKPI